MTFSEWQSDVIKVQEILNLSWPMAELWLLEYVNA